ncbi:hypothetical protein SPFL3102_01839 [Sporomusaceae bacterium FL31]|nr:hypothetical protein SPFL3101_03473 [Sporomusaceae bacterium FL31]GCE34030.1 hypothetical protein SPFL3102_01839 [Sporomusaceae bacterium]
MLINDAIWLFRTTWLQIISFASIFMYLWISYRDIKSKAKLAVIPALAVLITLYAYYQYLITGNILLIPGLIAMFCCAALVIIYWYFELSRDIALKLIFPVMILVLLIGFL